MNKNLLLLGAPGSGKGTQASLLTKQFELARIDTGNLIREAIKTQNELGKQAKSFVEQGQLVPDDLVINLILNELQKLAGQNFLLDGFPRNLKQAEALKQSLEETGIELNYALEIMVDFAQLTNRIAGRRICTNKDCGAVYHLEFSPPKQPDICDLCGFPLYQRTDDKPELVKARLDTYQNATLPLIDFYTKEGILHKIDGNCSPEEVLEAIIQKIT